METTAANAVIESHHTGSWAAQMHFIGDRVSFLTGTSKLSGDDMLTRRTGTVERKITERVGESGRIVFESYVITEDGTGTEHTVGSGRVRMLDDQTRPAPVETADPVDPAAASPLPRTGPESWGRWSIYRAGGLDDAMTGYGFAWAYARLIGRTAGVAWMQGQEARVEFTPLDNSGMAPRATGATQSHAWTVSE